MLLSNRVACCADDTLLRRQANPLEWGECNLSIGVAWAERDVEGSAREDSLDNAMNHLTAALEVCATAPLLLCLQSFQHLFRLTNAREVCEMYRKFTALCSPLNAIEALVQAHAHRRAHQAGAQSLLASSKLSKPTSPSNESSGRVVH